MVDASGGGSAASKAYRFIASLAVVFIRLLRWRITVVGLEHVPRSGGAVLTWNHTAHVDFVMAGWGLRRIGRLPRFLAKRELWTSRWTRGVVRAVGAVPVDRGSGTARAQSFAAAVEALRRGAIVAVAPEGTISPSFELLPFRLGAARMAQDAGVPVIPSVSWGSHRLVTSGHGFSLRRGYRIPVTIRYGEPIHIAPDEDAKAATARVRNATERLLHEAQERYPDGTPAGAWWVPARLGGGAPPPEADEREAPVADPGPSSDPPFELLESAVGSDAAASGEPGAVDGADDRAGDGGAERSGGSSGTNPDDRPPDDRPPDGPVRRPEP